MILIISVILTYMLVCLGRRGDEGAAEPGGGPSVWSISLDIQVPMVYIYIDIIPNWLSGL